MFYSGFSFGSFLCVSCIVLHFTKRWLQHLSALTKYISLEDFPTGTGSNSERALGMRAMLCQNWAIVHGLVVLCKN